MTNTLTKDNQDWIDQQVQEGHYSSENELINLAVETLKSIPTDDFSWAKLYVDQARKEIDAGHVSDASPFIEELRNHKVR